MSKRSRFVLVLAAALCVATLGRADVWDAATDNDDGFTTDTVLAHGASQVHDLAAHSSPAGPDQDTYVVFSAGFSSYEVVVDGVTGDLNLAGPDVVRLDPLYGFDQDSSAVDGVNVLRWENSSPASGVEYVRVRGALCGSSCTATDQYRIRFYETTYSIPRFSNASGESTVIFSASLSSLACEAHFLFYDDAGVFLGFAYGSYTNRRPQTLNTAALSFAAGKSGWVVITHTCGYTGLSGKGVTLHPATGVTFDTPFVPRGL